MSVYEQYISYYNYNNDLIYHIDQLPYEKREKAQGYRNFILAAQAELYQTYSKDYNTSLAQFQNDCKKLENDVTLAYQHAMGSGSEMQFLIQQDFEGVQSILTQMSAITSGDAATLNAAVGLYKKIADLQSQVNQLSPGPVRDQAQKDLQQARSELELFVDSAAKAIAVYNANVSRINHAAQVGGILAELTYLASLINPQEQDLHRAHTILGQFQQIASLLNQFQEKEMESAQKAYQKVCGAIQKVQNDLSPPPPPGKIEHSCWYIDWTSWDFPIPEGVNLVNVFVGKLDIQNGKPTLSGFGNMDVVKLKDFVKRCQAKGIAVKVSIGGGGGSYDKCWDLLTKENISQFAQGLVKFCRDNGVAGVDFDYEEYASVEQEVLVGQLIYQFKKLDGELQATLCTNAGFGPFYPWPAIVKNILDASKDPKTGVCPLDRLYIMSYYNAQSDEEGWLLGWAAWAKQNYGLEPSQITVGIDDFDAHAYDIAAFSKWAASQGFSTAYWAWNPATASSSNKSSAAILNAYQAAQGSSVLAKVFDSFKRLVSNLIESLFVIKKVVDLRPVGFRGTHHISLQPKSGTMSKLESIFEALFFSEEHSIEVMPVQSKRFVL